MKVKKNKKYNIGLVIGRFQPFHLGHKYLIEETLIHCEKIVIGIGSANKKSKKNPWSASKRRKILQEFIKQKGYESRVFKIINLNDNPDDDVWFQNLIKKTGPFDVTLGNNAWNNGIIERHGISVVTIGFYKREILEGKIIRDLIAKNKNWQDRVPQYLIKFLTQK